jgi:hypothetical protein
MKSVDGPTQDERLDFLRQAIAFTEWTIRSFDTRAQISIVAFVLSMNPLWSILTFACRGAGSSLIVAVLLLLFVTSIFLFASVILPGGARQSNTNSGWPTKALIYVGNASQITASLYTNNLKEFTSEAELAAETLKLSRIRNIKSRRFKYALSSAGVFYAWAVVAFLQLRNCGATG